MDWKDVSTERLVQAIKSGRMTRRQMNQALASVGLVSIGDLVKAELKEVAHENQHLRQYIEGGR